MMLPCGIGVCKWPEMGRGSGSNCLLQDPLAGLQNVVALHRFYNKRIQWLAGGSNSLYHCKIQTLIAGPIGYTSGSNSSQQYPMAYCNIGSCFTAGSKDSNVPLHNIRRIHRLARGSNTSQQDLAVIAG
jgi:hypothetical protein